jgi:hypothetical protein
MTATVAVKGLAQILKMANYFLVGAQGLVRRGEANKRRGVYPKYTKAVRVRFDPRNKFPSDIKGFI